MVEVNGPYSLNVTLPVNGRDVEARLCPVPVSMHAVLVLGAVLNGPYSLNTTWAGASPGLLPPCSVATSWMFWPTLTSADGAVVMLSTVTCSPRVPQAPFAASLFVFPL